MLNEPVLVDTGALLAIYNAKDVHHEACTKQGDELPLGKAFTCWPVATEAAYMLRNYPTRRDHLLGRLGSEELLILPLRARDLQGIRDVFDKYHDQEVDLADACLVYLADREDIGAVFTTDRRHFEVYRKANGDAFRVLPESDA